MSSAGVGKIESWNVDALKAWEGHLVDGRFPLRRFVGSSDHSAVFLTERNSSQAAVKLIAAGAEVSAQQLARWRAAAQLSHPHLLRIFESGTCQVNGVSCLYAVMEFADEDLSQILPQRALAPPEVGDMLPPVLDALSYLHARGLVHGRVKPSNILAAGEQLKLSADQLQPSENGSGRTRRDVYDAPETATGVVSPAGDMWSLGATLLTCLTQEATLAAAPDGDPAVPKTVPEPFRGIVRECLHVEPKQRCSIAQIQARLQPRARSVPADPESIPTRESSGKRLSIVIVTLAVILAIAIALAIAHYRRRAPSPVTTSEPAAAKSTPNPKSISTSAPATKPTAKTAASGGAVLRRVLPEVPQSARNTITGKIRVSVRVEVDPSGKVTSARLTSPGPSKYFARLALKAAQDWEFSPPEVSGEPAASTWTLRFRFGRTRTEVSPERAKR
ncbi:MAG TPA: TonB family protein [Verrucomicrobiae bacterium]|nr:TonB family protein [Verrucomicrobiae bacterium]